MKICAVIVYQQIVLIDLRNRLRDGQTLFYYFVVAVALSVQANDLLWLRWGSFRKMKLDFIP